MHKHVLPMLFLTAGLFYPALTYGGTRSAGEAQELAASFFRNEGVPRLSETTDLTLAYIQNSESAPTYYVFNASQGKGFVIVSADDSVLPILGFSTSSVWNTSNLPPLAEQLLANTEMPAQSAVMRRAPRANDAEKVLNTAKWSQEAPFNNKIPNRRLVGCVGTALAEIMKFHNFPVSRPTSLVRDGENESYDWSHMREDNYRNGYSEEEATAVATLAADAAVAIGTDFGMSSSSAFEVRVPSALATLFGYDAGVSYKKGSEMDRTSWEELLIAEIDAERPVLYSGQDVSEGHAFVCDGYKTAGPVTYLHINWGWGGAADGFFTSDALNPSQGLSRPHSFNNLTTIVYNIKPAMSAVEYSPIHITSDECQIGMTMDVTDLRPTGAFTVRAGALKNISDKNFSGVITAGLFSADGNLKTILSTGKNIGIPSLQITKYIDLSCHVPSGIIIDDSDVVKLVTKESGSETWQPVANDLITTGEASATGYSIPYVNITIPSAVEGVEITCPEQRVIKGRDFTFAVSSLDPSNLVVTVKAQGYILTPDANDNYRIDNVNTDQEVTILVQNASDVVSRRILWVEAGSLSSLIDEVDAANITDLTLFGSLNANDFTFMRDRMKLSRLDISETNIAAIGVNPANAIPAKAFNGCKSLKEIILPRSLNTFKSGCFSYSGLQTIEIPASVGTYEYNIFLGCSNLKKVIARRNTPAWVNWCVFNGTPRETLVVPVGSRDAYQTKDYWKDFRNIIEENATAPTQYKVFVNETKGVKYTILEESASVDAGSSFRFKVEIDDSHGDATMEMYANGTRLYPDESGVFTAIINTNTLIHADFKEPVAPLEEASSWKLTGTAGGVGLVTDAVNVVPGRSFTVRANAIQMPADDSQFYCAVLTDKEGRIKEFISPIVTNYDSRAGSFCYNFVCQVKEASVREGNLIRIATSYSKKYWRLVAADNDTICDRISAIGNKVVYHTIDMPKEVEGATMNGVATQIVRGMPFNLKVMPVSSLNRVSISVNGVVKVDRQATGSISIPAVTEDLEIAIQINPAGVSDYTVINVREGELADKLAACRPIPTRLKIIGAIQNAELQSLKSIAGLLVDLDLADLTISGAADKNNAIADFVLADDSSVSDPALKTVILPTNLKKIGTGSFYRCKNLAEITIPATVDYIGSRAFQGCSSLSKIIAKPATPPYVSDGTTFPTDRAITLEVPAGSEDAYNNAPYWKNLSTQTASSYYNIQIDRTRSFNYNDFFDLGNIEYTGGSQKSISVGLPNCKIQKTSDKPEACNNVYRPGVAFKFFDNGKNPRDNGVYSAYSDYAFRNGQYSVGFDSYYTNPNNLRHPQNHIIDVVFYYPINTNDKPENVNVIFSSSGELVWTDVDMTYFGGEGTAPILYREGSGHKFRLELPENRQATVELETIRHISSAPGLYGAWDIKEETVRTALSSDSEGFYTIPELDGRSWLHIKTTFIPGSEITTNDIPEIPEEIAADVTELSLDGELSDEIFQTIRDNFNNLETLDLTEMENTSLPENAFAGLEHLKSIVVSDNVTAIGSNAFAGCASLESVTLPGVSVIGENAFAGCDALTSIAVFGTTESPVAALGIKSRTVGISEKSFAGISPNCLIYLSEGLEAAIGNTPNVIINKGGTRVALNDIVLDGKYAFNAPASFNLADHKISITVNIPGTLTDEKEGWKGLILPFTPSSYEFGKDFNPRNDNPISLLSFDDSNSTVLSAQSAIEANRPYLAIVHAPLDTVPVTFTAISRSIEGEFDIPFTPVPEELKSEGKDFTLYGMFSDTKESANLYLLDETGSTFELVEADTAPSINPFGVYMCANHESSASSFECGTHPIWVMNPEASIESGAKLYRSTPVELTSRTEDAVIYYTLDGTDPVANGKVYSEPLTISGDNLIITAIAKKGDSYSETVNMQFEIRKTNLEYNFAEGWNWISHNVENELPLSCIMNDKISHIMSQTQEAIFNSQDGPVGTLSGLKPLETYKVRTSDVSTSAVNGISFDPSTPVSLVKGWNWIGFPLEEGPLSLNDALSNLDVEEGDMVVGIEGFAQADAEGQWIGTLSEVFLGQGYMYLSGSDKELLYNTVPSASENQDTRIPGTNEAGWQTDRHRYPSVMPVISRLVDNNQPVGDDEYEIAAFCGSECRGEGILVNGYMMISVFGKPGDNISFQAYSTETHSRTRFSETMRFAEEPVGSLTDPFVFDLASTTSIEEIGNGAFQIYVENGSIVVKGDCSSYLIDVYSIAGLKMGSTQSAREFDLVPGFYIVTITGDNGITSHKFEVK